MGGRHPPVPAPGEVLDLPGDRPRAAARGKQSGTPLGRPHAAPAPGVRGDRYGGPQAPARDRGRRSTPPRTRGTLAHPPPSSPTTRRTTELALRTGRTRACWAGARAEAGGRHPQGTRGPIRWPTTTRSKTIRDTAPSGRARYTRSETAPPRPEAQDTRRGRPGAPSSKTSSLRHRLQDPPRHARQLKHRRQPCRAQRHLSQ